MNEKPLPKFSRLDKVISIGEAAASVGCAVLIVRGIKDRRWKKLYTALVASGVALDAFGFLKGFFLARRAPHEGGGGEPEILSNPRAGEPRT